RRARPARLGPGPRDRAPGRGHARGERARRQRLRRRRPTDARAADAADGRGGRARGSSTSSPPLRVLSGAGFLIWTRPPPGTPGAAGQLDAYAKEHHVPSFFARAADTCRRGGGSLPALGLRRVGTVDPPGRLG